MEIKELTASELRIGNLILMKGFHAVIITADYIVSIQNGDNRFEPIPLTEEWLLKFGFKAITNNSAGKIYSTVIDGVFSSDLTFVFWETTAQKGRIYRHNTEIKYVHQLQNLYFALTNEELTWK
jgi:hypothetical protein